MYGHRPHYYREHQLRVLQAHSHAAGSLRCSLQEQEELLLLLLLLHHAVAGHQAGQPLRKGGWDGM